MPLFIFVLSILSSATAYAQAQEKPGWNYAASLAIAHGKEESNFNTNKNRKNGDLDSGGSSDTSTRLLPGFSVNYVPEDDETQIYSIETVTQSGPVPFVLEFGFTKKLDNKSSISLALSPALIDGETFADPFITDISREETDISSNHLALDYQSIAGSPFSFYLKYFEQKVDNEDSGREFLGEASGGLNRDGDGYESKLLIDIPLENQKSVGLGLIYGNYEAKGGAVSYDQRGIELRGRKIIDRHIISASISYEALEYDDNNPIFEELLEEEIVSINTQYVYNGLLDMEELSVFSILSQSENKASIDFYDEENLTLIVGASYQF